MNIYLLDMLKPNSEINSFYNDLLKDEDEYDYIVSIKSPKRLCDYVMGRFALYKACEHEGIDKNDKILKDEKGKPYFQSNNKHFNISHSGTVCVVAVSDDLIGIDIQKIHNFKDEFIEKHFHENEKNIIKATTSLYFKNVRCTEFWACKESLLKCVGIGLSKDLSKIDVSKVSCVFNDVKYLVEAFVLNEQYICACSEIEKKKSKIVENVIEL